MAYRNLPSLTAPAARLMAIVGLLLTLTVIPLSYAASLQAPQGEVLLTIRGNVSSPNVGDEIQLDLALLESMPAVSFVTKTPWDEGPQSFTGVRLSHLFELAGTDPDSFVATGTDDYKFTVSDLDTQAYPVIVAYKHNGDYISLRKLGPLRIMLPFDDYPELLTQMNESGAVWQLVELELL